MIYDKPIYRPLGDCMLAVEFGDEANLELNFKVLELERLVEQGGNPGVIETVPSLRELVLVFDGTKTTNSRVQEAVDRVIAGTRRRRRRCLAVGSCPAGTTTHGRTNWPSATTSRTTWRSSRVRTTSPRRGSSSGTRRASTGSCASASPRAATSRPRSTPRSTSRRQSGGPRATSRRPAASRSPDSRRAPIRSPAPAAINSSGASPSTSTSRIHGTRRFPADGVLLRAGDRHPLPQRQRARIRPHLERSRGRALRVRGRRGGVRRHGLRPRVRARERMTRLGEPVVSRRESGRFVLIDRQSTRR